MITSPTLLLNKNIVLKNIETMAAKAKAANTIFRPHFKTHQSAETGSWFRDYGVECITVSSLKMAAYFAVAGWNDITIAFPVNILEWKEINELAEKINLNILIENNEAISFLEKKLTNPVGVYIKTDTGYGRTGVDAENMELIGKLLEPLKTSKKLIFIGFLTHAGHTYHAHTTGEIKNITADSIRKMLALKTFLRSDFPMLQISYGDTPSCSIATPEELNDLDEIRPGNFVFYDEMQFRLGACSRENIAVALAAPVVAKHPERNEITIHGGAVHLSKEFLTDEHGNNYYGTVTVLDGYTPDVKNIIGKITEISQEHGIVKIDDKNILKNIKPGDMIAVLPAHSCLTANLMKGYVSANGEYITMMI
ncbi:MAG: alanine racemase [Chlorobi bacterium]|nr:alanine racemase [Chlorobiota bacterium]